MSSQVLVLGTFDIFHVGHLQFLQRAQVLGWITVGLASDWLARQTKRRTIQNYPTRRLMLTQLGYPVIAKEAIGALTIVNYVKPDVIAFGSDWTRADWLKHNALSESQLTERDIDLVRITNPDIESTTAIIERAAASAAAQF